MVTSSSVHIMNQLFDIGRKLLKQKICGYCQLIAMFKVIYLTDKFLYGKKAVGFPWWHFRCKMPGI